MKTSKPGEQENPNDMDKQIHEVQLSIAAPTDMLAHLLRRAYFHAEGIFHEHYAALNITSRQLALMRAVARNPCAVQTVLAHEIGLDANTFSDLAKRTEKKGWIRRQRNAEDRRAFSLCLTESGREVLEACLAITPSYTAKVSERLNDGERQELRSLIQRMLGLEIPK